MPRSGLRARHMVDAWEKKINWINEGLPSFRKEKIETQRTKKFFSSGWVGRSAAKFKDRPAVGQAPAACCWGNWGLPLGLGWVTFLLVAVQLLGHVRLFETP